MARGGLAPHQPTANLFIKLSRINERKLLPLGGNHLTKLFTSDLIYSILEELALLKGDYSQF